MCEHSLPRNRESEAGTAGLVRDVWIPDPLELVGRDSTSIVRHLDPHGITAADPRLRSTYCYTTLAVTCVYCVENDIGERGRECVVMPEYSRKVAGCLDLESDPRRNAGRCGVSHQLRDVDFGRRTFRQPSKLCERTRNSLEPLRLDREDIDGLGELW